MGACSSLQSHSDDCPRFPDAEEGYCVRQMDHASNCWERMEINETVTKTCLELLPIHLHPFIHPEENITRLCTGNVTYPVVNYTNCFIRGPLDDSEKEHKVVSILSMAGNGLSLAALVLALAVFFSLRSISCSRIHLHQNLIGAFLYNSLLQIIWEQVHHNVEVLNANPIWCRLAHVLARHAVLSTYAWMFCEGCYLQSLLLWPLIPERKILYALMAFGWLVPSFLVIVYVVIRMNLDCAALASCWVYDVPDLQVYLFEYFVVATMVLNLLFLLNIIRIVYLKSDRCLPQNANRTAQLRTLLKALLILMPLLGAQYVLISAGEYISHQGLTPLKILQVAFTSLQGFAVAVVVCFVSCEQALKRKWFQWKSRLLHPDERRARASRAATHNITLTTFDTATGEHLPQEHDLFLPASTNGTRI